MWRRRGVVRGRGVAPRGRPPHTYPHTPAHGPRKMSGVVPVAGGTEVTREASPAQSRGPPNDGHDGAAACCSPRSRSRRGSASSTRPHRQLTPVPSQGMRIHWPTLPLPDPSSRRTPPAMPTRRRGTSWRMDAAPPCSRSRPTGPRYWPLPLAAVARALLVPRSPRAGATAFFNAPAKLPAGEAAVGRRKARGW